MPREEKILPAPTTFPECGGDKFRKISDDMSETLEYVPAAFKVIRTIRPRCACINCEKIVQAYTESKAIAKGKAGEGLLSHIIVSKYCDHLPLYRQAEIFERQGRSGTKEYHDRLGYEVWHITSTIDRGYKKRNICKQPYTWR